MTGFAACRSTLAILGIGIVALLASPTAATVTDVSASLEEGGPVRLTLAVAEIDELRRATTGMVFGGGASVARRTWELGALGDSFGQGRASGSCAGAGWTRGDSRTCELTAEVRALQSLHREAHSPR